MENSIPTTQALIEFLEEQARDATAYLPVTIREHFQAAADALRSLPPAKEAMICEFCNTEEGDIPSYLEVCPSCWTKANEGSGWMQHCFDLRAEVARLTERIGPISPGGDDRIDELESAIGFLRHRAETAESEVARLTQTRNALVDAVAPLVARVHEDGVDAPYPEREWAPLLTNIATLVRSMA